jgi:RNA polymerase sigma factor (sigma-70 family)
MDARTSRERLLGPALRTQPDRRLAALARAGSEPALDEVVRRYRAPLVRYAGSIVGAAAAEDVVQDALAKALPALAGSEGELRLRPWLYAIVRNTGLNHLRDAGPASEPLDENYDGVEQPPQALERREGLRSLVVGLRGLPRPQREALVKRELEGRSHAEIGAELGVTTGAARQLIFRARESLRVGFGSLLPMPLLRWLAEGGGDGTVGAAAGAGGGALAAKAAVALIATGAAVTGAVAVHQAQSGRAGPQPKVSEARLPVASDDAGGSRPAGAAIETAEESGGRGDAGSTGPGPGRGEGGGEGRGGGNSGPGSDEQGGSRHGGSSGSNNGSDGGGGSQRGDGSSGGSSEDGASAVSVDDSSGPGPGDAAVAPEPEPLGDSSGSGGSSSGSDSSGSDTSGGSTSGSTTNFESSRDLSGGGVSQEMDNPD